MEKEQIKTADGSHSIFLPEMNEHYHSKHGAIAESQHIFIAKGLKEAVKDLNKVKILEVGMGTGLNVLTSYKASIGATWEVEMHTVEAFPLSWEEVKDFNYIHELGLEQQIFQQLHQSSWSRASPLASNFTLFKYHSTIKLFLQEDIGGFDLVYFDAFAPEKQAEMWSEEVFSLIFSKMKEGGILVTYCVKGEIRRRLQSIGFTIEKLAGPIGGKREMLRARKEVYET